MYDLINNISKRCHDAATKRGKDTSCVGCLQYLAVELREYWDAVDKGRNVPDFVETVQKANALPDAEFNALYAAKIHNTAADELADVLIVAASWIQAAKLAEGDDFQPNRSLDVVLASGAVQFVCGQITCAQDLEELRQVVNLKMRYNETRND